MTGVFHPMLCVGKVFHTRPGVNRFAYPLGVLRIPLSQLAGLDVALFSVDQPNVFALYRRDHGARDGSSLEVWMRDVLAAHALALADGEIVLQTMPRMLGYVFNPVSLWFCHDRAGALRAVLAEVRNTFGEHHNYLIAHSDRRPILASEELVAQKVFHVSPFFPVAGEYRFRFRHDGGIVCADIDYWEGGVCCLATRLAGREMPLDAAALRRWLLHMPLMTLGVVFRIHWQALRLALFKVPFFRKPHPPLKDISS